MKRAIGMLWAGLLLATGVTFMVTTSTETAVDAANPNKITICHRTAAVNNPYRRITVSKNSIADDLGENTNPGRAGHGQWSHNLWPRNSVAGLPDLTTRPSPNVFNPDWKTTYYSLATNKRWGDIIPPLLDNGTQHNAAAMGLNYSGAGEAIYNGTTLNGVNYGGLCKRQSAGQYCTSLIAEGGTLAECQSELEEMGALEDAESKKACGNSFTGCSLTTLNTINVRTGTVTCVANVPTFNGSASTGTAANNVSFEYGTDEFLSSATSIAGTPGTITGTGTFSATPQSGLADGTYYYRAVAIEPVNEGRLDGSIGSFSVTASGCTVLTAIDPEPKPAALKGKIWVDLNKNGKQDPGEPGIPNVPVEAKSGSTTKTTTTDANGNYLFDEVDPGEWTVTATLGTVRLQRTFDTQGAPEDWVANATVPLNGTGEADFAAVGAARLSFSIEPSNACRRASTIEVVWAGVDNKLKTADDVTFTGDVSQQSSILRGMPWGSYSVTGICADGTRMSTQKFTVSKTASTKVTTMSVPLTIATPDTLPATGVDMNRTALVLSTLLFAGGLMITLSQRRVQR